MPIMPVENFGTTISNFVARTLPTAQYQPPPPILPQIPTQLPRPFLTIPTIASFNKYSIPGMPISDSYSSTDFIPLNNMLRGSFIGQSLQRRNNNMSQIIPIGSDNIIISNMPLVQNRWQIPQTVQISSQPTIDYNRHLLWSTATTSLFQRASTTIDYNHLYMGATQVATTTVLPWQNNWRSSERLPWYQRGKRDLSRQIESLAYRQRDQLISFNRRENDWPIIPDSDKYYILRQFDKLWQQRAQSGENRLNVPTTTIDKNQIGVEQTRSTLLPYINLSNFTYPTYPTIDRTSTTPPLIIKATTSTASATETTTIDKSDNYMGRTPPSIAQNDDGLHSMDCTDMIIGSAFSSFSRIRDYYSHDRSRPHIDADFGGEDSLIAAFGVEIDGRTILMLRRKIQTNDAFDHQMSTDMHVIWARGQSQIELLKDTSEFGKAKASYYFEKTPFYHGMNRKSMKINFLE